MVAATLFIVAKNSKQLNGLLMGEWLNKLWYVHAENYY